MQEAHNSRRIQSGINAWVHVSSLVEWALNIVQECVLTQVHPPTGRSWLKRYRCVHEWANKTIRGQRRGKKGEERIAYLYELPRRFSSHQKNKSMNKLYYTGGGNRIRKQGKMRIVPSQCQHLVMSGLDLGVNLNTLPRRIWIHFKRCLLRDA